VSWDMKGVGRAGSGEMSRGRDAAEGTFSLRTVLFEMTAGSTLETLMVVEGSRVGRGLSSKGSSPTSRACAAFRGRGGTGDGVWHRRGVSCHRKGR